MRRCVDEKMWRWEYVKMRICEDEKTRRCKDEQIWRWEDVKVIRCEDEKMWRWEDVKMSSCDDVKMFDRLLLLEERFAQTLSGKMKAYRWGHVLEGPEYCQDNLAWHFFWEVPWHPLCEINWRFAVKIIAVFSVWPWTEMTRGYESSPGGAIWPKILPIVHLPHRVMFHDPI
jgi:hypothetical protein